MASVVPSDEIAIEGSALERKRLGIITGSGPEAGLQLWSAILTTVRQRLGESYRGDIDAPFVTIISDPALGYSMELQLHQDVVLQRLTEAMMALDESTDVYAIACITLHSLLPQIEGLTRSGTLVSAIDSIVSYVTSNSLKRLAVLRAEAVAREECPLLSRLNELATIELPSDPSVVRELVWDIKRLGATDPLVMSRFRRLVDSLTSETVLLACTDLPLVCTSIDGRRVIDCTKLLAESLVEQW